MTFSSVRIEIPAFGFCAGDNSFDPTLPLPLQSLVSDVLYQSFASEIDAICVSTRKNINFAYTVVTGVLVSLILCAIGSIKLPFLLIPVVAFILIALCSVPLACWFSSCVTQQAAEKIKRVCGDYSRRFGTITVHYKEDDRQGKTKSYLELYYGSDSPVTVFAVPLVEAQVIELPSAPMQEELTHAEATKVEMLRIPNA